MPKPKVPEKDWSKVTKMIKKSAKKDRRMAHKQIKWAREWYKEAHTLNADVVKDLDDVRTLQLSNMQEVNKRYRDVYWPLEDEQIAEVNEFQERAKDFDEEVAVLKEEALKFKSEANQKYMAGKAQAEVGQAFLQETAAAEQALKDQGINPNSAASQSLANSTRLAKGAAMAAAGTQAADATRVEGDVKYQAALDRQIQAGQMAQTGLQLQAGMVDVGRQYPGEVGASGAAVGAAGAQAVDSTVAIGDAATRQRALAAEYRRLNAANLQTWTDAIDKSFRNKLDLYKAETEAAANESSGIGSALGAAAGVVAAFVADGGYIEQEFANGGGVNEPNLSGTGGSTGNYRPTGATAAATQPPPRFGAPAPTTDKVPAKLSVGEFVVPKHVVDWKGQEFFQNMIKKAPQQKQEMIAQTGAVPKMRPDMNPGAVPI